MPSGTTAPSAPASSAGALLVQEAHGTISDVRGQPWSLGSSGFLAAAPPA